MLLFSIIAAQVPQDDPSWWEEILRDGLMWVWGQISSIVSDVFDGLLSYLIDAVPQDYSAHAEAFRHYLEVANCWVALDYGLTMFGVFYAYLAVFVVIKFTIKLIPTVG